MTPVFCFTTIPPMLSENYSITVNLQPRGWGLVWSLGDNALYDIAMYPIFEIPPPPLLPLMCYAVMLITELLIVIFASLN